MQFESCLVRAPYLPNRPCTSGLFAPFKTAARHRSYWSASVNGNRRISCLEIFRCGCLSPRIPRTCASWHYKTNRWNTLPSGPLVEIWLQHPACLRWGIDKPSEFCCSFALFCTLGLYYRRLVFLELLFTAGSTVHVRKMHRKYTTSANKLMSSSQVFFTSPFAGLLLFSLKRVPNVRSSF